MRFEKAEKQIKPIVLFMLLKFKRPPHIELGEFWFLPKSCRAFHHNSEGESWCSSLHYRHFSATPRLRMAPGEEAPFLTTTRGGTGPPCWMRRNHRSSKEFMVVTTTGLLVLPAEPPHFSGTGPYCEDFSIAPSRSEKAVVRYAARGKKKVRIKVHIKATPERQIMQAKGVNQ